MIELGLNPRLMQQLAFLVEIDKLKSILRQTLIIDRSRQENDAEHSWHFAVMAMLLFEYCPLPEADLNRVLKMALIHDLVEVYAGDTFAYDSAGYESKQEREREAAEKLFSILPDTQRAELEGLWREFEAGETQSAMYAAAIDRFQPLLHNYLTEGHAWRMHNVTSAQVYRRMEPLRMAVPELWRAVDAMVKSAIEKGYLRG